MALHNGHNVSYFGKSLKSLHEMLIKSIAPSKILFEGAVCLSVKTNAILLIECRSHHHWSGLKNILVIN